MPTFHHQKREKKLSEAECDRGLAKESIENEQWTTEKSVVDENVKCQNKKTSQKVGGEGDIASSDGS